MGNDHSFDYDGAMQNMSLGSVLQRKEELFSKKQEVQGSANTHSDYFLLQKKKNNTQTNPALQLEWIIRETKQGHLETIAKIKLLGSALHVQGTLFAAPL